MYKEVLQSIEGIGIYPIISMIVFVIFFVIVLIWYFKADKKYLNKMSNLPLDDDEKIISNNTGENHDQK
ncbi:MAG: cbb3-type cytochrome c oxidase subunit 3 [Ignavibacteriaceae bacterium]